MSQQPRGIEENGEKRLLLVEDETTLREAIAAFIESRDVFVARAGSLAEARAWLGIHAFDAMVIDVGLPDGDGLTLLDPATAGRAVVISANPDPQRYSRCGVRHHLCKPFELGMLAVILDALMRSSVPLEST